jgi:hypothetical protein
LESWFKEFSHAVRSSQLGKYAVCQLKIEWSVGVRSQPKLKSVREMLT